MDVGGSLTGEQDRIHATLGELLVGEAQDGKGAILVGGRGDTSEGGDGGESVLHDDLVVDESRISESFVCFKRRVLARP